MRGNNGLKHEEYVFAGAAILYFGSLQWRVPVRKTMTAAGIGLLVLNYAVVAVGFFCPAEFSSGLQSATVHLNGMQWLFLIPGVSLYLAHK